MKEEQIFKDKDDKTEVENLELFIKNKKAQTKVLKKIITKLNSEENRRINK